MTTHTAPTASIDGVAASNIVPTLPIMPSDAAVTSTQTFSINDYAGWFEKINLNTLVWQVIVILLLIIFVGEIKGFIRKLIDKIPQLESAGAFKFQLSQETIKVIEDSPQKLQDEVGAYREVTGSDPNIVFLTIYIDMESSLMELYSRIFKADGLGALLSRPHKIISDLVEKKILEPVVQGIHADIRPLRNEIAHGKKPLKNFDMAQPYLKTLLLLKEKVTAALIQTAAKA